MRDDLLKLTDKPMTEDFRELIAFAARFRDKSNVLTPEQFQVYWNALHKYDLTRISVAINEHFKDLDRGSFTPSPGDIIRYIPNEKNLGRNCMRPDEHRGTVCDCASTPTGPAPARGNLPVCFDGTKPKPERLVHINALLALSDDELEDQGYTRGGLTFLLGMMDKVVGDDDLLRDRLRRRHGLEPLFPNTERDALRADYQAARAKGDYDTAVALVGRLVDGMESGPEPVLQPAHEGMMDPGMAAEIRDGLNMPKPKRARTTKGGAQDKTTT